MSKVQRYPKTIESAVVTEKNGTLKERLKALDADLALKAPVANPTLTGTPKAPTPGASSNDTQIATTAFVNSQIASKIAVADAMIYKGTIGTGGTITALPAAHTTGWTYKVITAGTYAGQKCEIGDMIICLTTDTTANDSHWTVVQTNIDGAVIGPDSTVADRIAVFNGATGKIIKDGGATLSQLVQTSRNVIAGNGLTGGGTLGTDITLNVGAGTGITVAADTISHQTKPTAGTDAGGSGSVVTGVTIDTMGHVVSTTKGNITSVTGNAGTATKLQTARSISVESPHIISQNASFDGSLNATIKQIPAFCICLDPDHVSTSTLEAKYGKYYIHNTVGSLKTFEANTHLGGPGSREAFNLIADLIPVGGGIDLCISPTETIRFTVGKMETFGNDVPGYKGSFHYKGYNYYAIILLGANDGGVFGLFLFKDRGTPLELPNYISSDFSGVTLLDLIGKGFSYYDQDNDIRYEYNGADWLYELYVTN